MLKRRENVPAGAGLTLGLLAGLCGAVGLVLACVDKGSKFVFIQGDKVLEIQNQDAKGLREAAGKKVTVKGELSSDGNSVKITGIKPAK